MLMHNEFDGRDEVVFIEYDGVIKNSNQFLLQKLGGRLYPLYKDFLNLERVKDKNNLSTLTLAHMMTKPNIFDNFKKAELPEGWYSNYLDLYFSFPEMYEECSLLDMGTSLYSLLPQKFIQKIIFWSPYDDERIPQDIYLRYPDTSKIVYMSGSLDAVLADQPSRITTYMLSNVVHVSDIVTQDKEVTEYTEIMIAKYRYNQTYNEQGMLESLIDSDKLMERFMKVSEFVPATLEPHHFFELINK